MSSILYEWLEKIVMTADEQLCLTPGQYKSKSGLHSTCHLLFLGEVNIFHIYVLSELTLISEIPSRFQLHLHSQLNTLRPRQNGHYFADDIFKCIFFYENA